MARGTYRTSPFQLRRRGDTWHVRFSVPGRGQVERSTGSGDARQARVVARRIWLEAQKNPPAKRNQAVAEPLKLTIARWLASKQRDGTSSQWVETITIYARAYWLSRWQSIRDVTGDAVARYIDDRRATGVTDSTIRKELSALSGLLKWALDEHLIDVLPAWKAPRGKSSRGESVSLSPAEVEAVIALLPTRADHPKGYPCREMIVIAYELALRLGTLTRLRWQDVDLERRELTIRPEVDKARFARTLPLTSCAVEVLSSLRADVACDGTIFRRCDLRVTIRDAMLRAGIDADRVRRCQPMHVWRHSRLSILASQPQVNLAALRYLAGHKQLATTDRYVHSTVDDTRALLEGAAT